MRKVAIPYYKDSSQAYGHLASRSDFVFLDSGYPYSAQGRFDILAAEPMMMIKTMGKETHCRKHDQHWISGDDPFQILKRYLGDITDVDAEIPFVGGAIGYFSYDLGRRLESLPVLAENDLSLPEMIMGIYDWAVIVDHLKQCSWLVAADRDPKTAEIWQDLLITLQRPTESISKNEFKVTGAIESNMEPAIYGKAFDRIKHYIHEGDCYQVNLAQRFSVAVKGDPWNAYLSLRQKNPAPFSAFMPISDGAILSSSPERFIKIDQGEVETKPIKGTRPRGKNKEEDRQLADELRRSKKDRAENLMIVDLLRNDLGKNCATGSVSVPHLFEIESYATVHHLVSTVRGKLSAPEEAIDLLAGAFPGGSITGAPKLRSMEIIEELEPHRRSVYCGSIGYIGFDGNVDTNIAIRTMVWDEDKIHVWAGGGIVLDSDVDEEYQETFDKAEAMLAVLKEAQNE